MSYNTETVGTFLKRCRTELRLTLRAVEETTGISNAYLSQLEGDKIKKPSPSILYKLTNLYKASYSRAMQLADYPVPSDDQAQTFTAFASRIGPTTQDEEDALMDYLAFLRTKRMRQ